MELPAGSAQLRAAEFLSSAVRVDVTLHSNFKPNNAAEWVESEDMVTNHIP